MKLLQGNLDFFLIRASRGPFRLKHKTQGPSHIHIPKGKLSRVASSGHDGAGAKCVGPRGRHLLGEHLQPPALSCSATPVDPRGAVPALPASRPRPDS